METEEDEFMMELGELGGVREREWYFLKFTIGSRKESGGVAQW